MKILNDAILCKRDVLCDQNRYYMYTKEDMYMAVEFRTLTIDKCPHCGCTNVVKEEIELARSGEFNENSNGRKEHRWFKCGCHAYTSYEHIMPENIWEWQTKTNSISIGNYLTLSYLLSIL